MRGGRRRPNPSQLSLFDPSAPLPPPPPVADWIDGELLGFDLETTGVDRMQDVPVSFALVSMKAGVVTAQTIRLVNPARPIPYEATAVHGITTERARGEGIALGDAVELVADALIGASRRAVPVVGVKLDYDLTMIDALCRATDGRGLTERGWTGPVLDALVLDRFFDPERLGRRTLVDLCTVYDVTLTNPHSAEGDATAALGVLLAMARRYGELVSNPLHALHALQIDAHRTWAEGFDTWLRSEGHAGLDPSESLWPIASSADSKVGAA